MAKKGSKPAGGAEKIAPPKAAKKSGKPATAAKNKKQPAKKAVRKPRAPKITDAQFRAWFLRQDADTFIDLTGEWNDKKLRVKLKRQENYDAWFNYFKTLSINQNKLLTQTGLDILPTDGYAALRRWTDIVSNPARIDKIHRAGLTTGRADKTIVDYAKENNRLGVLEAMRDELALKLQQGAGARDAGTLAAQLTEIMTQIEVYRKRLGPKEETALGTLMADMPTKRPSENGGGRRHTSYASKAARVTIEDLEKAK